MSIRIVGARVHELDLAQPVAGLPVTFLDLETSGIDPRRGARITELAALDWTHALLHVGCDASERLPELIPELRRYLQSSIVVGHNVSFDLRHVAVAFEHAAEPFPARILALDTMIFRGRSGALRDLAIDHGIDTTGLHTAIRDAEICRELLMLHGSRSALDLGTRYVSIHGRATA